MVGGRNLKRLIIDLTEINIPGIGGSSIDNVIDCGGRKRRKYKKIGERNDKDKRHDFLEVKMFIKF